ncbi:Hypp3787 [Branchiostoma lanceolatum]|uniref:Hypp3787 protein n=1 Tax=Branchiostoma lanceolatum TaxID=7740 RepID=A0A8K0EYE6_BRALA|nr:Hypp3787 [Branchiostoma lanceolatum]
MSQAEEAIIRVFDRVKFSFRVTYTRPTVSHPAPGYAFSITAQYAVTSQWPRHFSSRIILSLPYGVNDGWTITLNFDRRVDSIEIWRAEITGTSTNRDTYHLSNISDNRDLPAGNYEITFNAVYSGTQPVLTSMDFNGQLMYGDAGAGSQSTAVPPTTATPTVAPAQVTASPTTTDAPTIAPAQVTAAPTTDAPTIAPAQAEDLNCGDNAEQAPGAQGGGYGGLSGVCSKGSLRRTPAIRTAMWRVLGGHALANHLINVIQSESRMDCCSECLNDVDCCSVNYDENTGRCELNGTDGRTCPTSVVHREGSAFYQPME